MEWVETTAKTIDAAREAALDQLGVAPEDAEFDILEEPRPGLFGRVRGEARLRARVRPTQARPKQERRRKSKDNGRSTTATVAEGAPLVDANVPSAEHASGTNGAAPTRRRAARSTTNDRSEPAAPSQEHPKMSDEHDTIDRTSTATVHPEEVAAAAVGFMNGLAEAFGTPATVEVDVDGVELDVRVDGSELGLLVGPGGRTLNAIQDLARVAAQRRLGDHETRLRIDVAGYRQRREAALNAFAKDVAAQVRSSGTARSLEPMASADRKVVHDALTDEPGIASRSVGEDPNRRIIVEPA
jgi:spoIIIJ-associated protein